MNNLDVCFLDKWEKDAFIFEGGYCFSSKGSNYSFLLSKEGSSIIISRSLLRNIQERTISEGLFRKLSSRGFILKKNQCVKKEKKLPVFLMIDITSKCNLDCSYCLRDFKKTGETIEEGTLKEILDFIIDYYRRIKRPLVIQPWGGEPLMAFDRILFVDDYLRNANVNFMIVIQTNGVLITEEISRIISERGFCIGVSVDGSSKVHDSFRRTHLQKGSFNQVKKGIDNLHKQNIWDIGSISVVSRMGSEMIEESINSMVEDLKLTTLKLNFLHPNSSNFEYELLVEDEKISLFWKKTIDTILRLNRNGSYCCELNLQDKLLNLLSGGCNDICHSSGCNGGKSLVSFSRYGEIYPCEMIDVKKYKIGSIYEKIPLDELIEERSDNPFFVEKTKDECLYCPWHPFCKGGCTAVSMFYGQGEGCVDPKECASNKSLYPLLVQLIITEPRAVEVLLNGKCLILE